MAIKIITKNKKAYFDYEILDTYEAGIKLTGAEVKSIKNGGISINEAYIKSINGRLHLWNASVRAYKHADDPNYDPGRSRALLLHKKEMEKLAVKSDAERLTIIPTKVYLSHGLIKLEIATAKGRKQHDKQRRIKERDLKRELHREKRKFMIK